MSKLIAIVTVLLLATAAARASTIVAPMANPTNPNTGAHAHDPATVYMAAGSYSVSVGGIAGGGGYDDADTGVARTQTIGAYPGPRWSLTAPDGATVTESGSEQVNNEVAPLVHFSALYSMLFALPSPRLVAFYLEDPAFPYFTDDVGGVALGVAGIIIPEPGSLALLGVGFIGIALLRRGRSGRAAQGGHGVNLAVRHSP